MIALSMRLLVVLVVDGEGAGEAETLAVGAEHPRRTSRGRS